MTREERLAILGPETVAEIHARVKAAPEPSDELVEELRRIMTNPAGEIPAPRPAPDVRPAADAA
ncbi:hypothetical protein [Streptomyces canus]|uniref:hypothetical protein n=1 Tax=Streptomyces canus TaxID=58343 RepID=UPI00037C8D52|nr:hypothetical protein [Streptomyces canus]